MPKGEPTAREWIIAVYREETPHNRFKIEKALEAAAEITEVPRPPKVAAAAIRALIEEIRNAE